MKPLKRRRKALHPIHLYSAGMLGSKREPMTWFQCPTCSYRTLGSPFRIADICEGRWAGPHEPATMVACLASEAAVATARACDGDASLIARTRI